MIADTAHGPVEEIPRLLELVGADVPPVNIGRIAELLGARIYAAELDNPSLDGLSTIDPAGATIYVSERLSPEWKRFVVAKELAHILLERSAKNGIRETDGSILEIATELLMPREQVMTAWSGSHNARKLALLFFVPEQVMKTRLAALDVSPA